MKRSGKIAICVAGGLAWCALAHAGGASNPANPYIIIAARNAFGLVPPATEEPPEIPGKPLPKILLEGIMSIFGEEQVLFKAVALQDSPGTRTIDSLYVLAEGERMDGVEVVRIDPSLGVVVFDNHGTVQQVSLTEFNVSANRLVMPPMPPRI